MRKPGGVGWRMVVGGIVAAAVLFGLATMIHLSLVSREIILAIVLFVPIVFGIMLIAEDRKSRRSEDSAWNYIENSDHYL